jgi:membrane-associated phospholipid phosphatase
MTNNWPHCRRLLLPALLLLAAVASLAVDLPIAGAFRHWNQKEIVHAYLGYFDIFEPFGHGLLGVSLVLFVLHQLDPSRRWAIPRVLACALAAGGITDLLKMLVVRIRPNDFAFVGSVGSTFGKWLPLLSAGSEGQSFASGHTATATALAAALVWLYPNGRLLFPLLAVLVGCQRIVAGAHYPSDVLTGAASGCLVALFFLHIGRLPRWFESRELRWRAKCSKGQPSR